MNFKKNLWIPALLLGSCASGPGAPSDDELIVCGADEVFGLEVPAAGAPRRVWGWKAQECPDLPDLVRKQFGSTDECKPVPGGGVLVTSSAGGVALVDRASGWATFWASVVNAHSAEAVPLNKLVVASSYGEGGNRLLLFDRSMPGTLLASEEFLGAHGVVWDPEVKLLWALGEIELRLYSLRDLDSSTPGFVLRHAYTLPNPGGHDLRPVPNSNSLSVSTGNHVWLFDRAHLNFGPCGGLSDLGNVKSVDVHPRTNRLAYVQAEKGYTAERVKFRNPEGEVTLPGLKIYKARWAVHLE
ncbi:MAG TPA: DUF6528 family protein [Planctomycetota bacterium]|nr:DUF6528 family protein [Planctomycetota bacterium]